MTDPMLAILQAYVSWLASQPTVAAMALKGVELDASLHPHPRYPANPTEYCDRLVLRAYTDDVTWRPNRGLSDAYRASLWYYRRQTPGQVHQVRLAEGLRIITTAIRACANPTPVAQAAGDWATVQQVVIHDELRHELDDPRLRVSVGEILLAIQAHN